MTSFIERLALTRQKGKQPQATPAKRWAVGHRLLYERPIAVLLVLLLTAVAAILWHTNRQQSILVEVQALQSAERLADALDEFRSIYTSEVVERVRGHGITVTHDYEHREGAIPLPATLSMMLGNQIGPPESQTRTRLYSAFPFPWRRDDGGLTDEFAKDAWAFLTKNPDTSFYRFEELGGVPVLRYATADLMRPACVDCHNSIADSPKTDWKIGDVRGVLEVISPLDLPLAQSFSGITDTAVLMLLMTLVGLLIMGVVLRHLRRIAAKAQDLARQTEETNKELESEVAERQRTQEALVKAKYHAEIANRAKSEFLANMSHELRTPLNAIIGFSDLLKSEAFGPLGDAKYTGYVTDIGDSGQHLLSLINDLLDLSRIEAGKLELAETNVDPEKVVRSSMRMLAERAQSGGVQLITEFPDGSLPTLRADARLVKQLLINLMSNAVKFTPSGGKVTVRTWAKRDSGLVFQVADTGIGIPEGDIPKALSRFGQVEGQSSRSHEGTGLGLPLSKSLIELHGGSLDLQSHVNVGTTVTVRFPASRIADPGQKSLCAS